MFQTTTILWHSKLHGAVTAAAHMVSCHILSIVCSKKSKPLGHCLLSRGGRATCSRTLYKLQQSRRIISWWGPACMQRWKKWQDITSRRVPKQCPSSFWGVYQQCIINCGRTFQTGSGRQLFLSRDSSWGRQPFRLLSLRTVTGRLDCVWVGQRVKH